MHIGIIYCGFATKDYVDRSLNPWLSKLGHKIIIAAVSRPFIGFDMPDDGTQEILKGYEDMGHLKLFTGKEPVKETMARQEALEYLLEQHVDVVWMVDSDEYYSEDDIKNILSFVEDEEFIAWFRVCYKNFVFDENHYLAEPFCPARIYRVKIANYHLGSFYDDNDINYKGRLTRDVQVNKSVANMTIPKEIAWIPHLTWLNDERGRSKVEYQTKRWGDLCSYKYCEHDQCLKFNDAYYQTTGIPHPKILEVNQEG